MKSPIVASLLASCALLLALPSGAFDADPAERCEALKLFATSRHAACSLRTEALSIWRGGEPDAARCEDRLARTFDRIERFSGPGVCPTEGDAAAVADTVAACTAELAEDPAPPDPDCPPGYRDRTPAEVVDDYLAAYAARDATALACAYHPDAYVIDDQGVLIGPDEIVQAALSLDDLFSGADFQVTNEVVFDDTARLLWELDGGFVVIPDGTDTFVIERGQIRRQTRHGLIEFTGPPPDQL